MIVVGPSGGNSETEGSDSQFSAPSDHLEAALQSFWLSLLLDQGPSSNSKSTRIKLHGGRGKASCTTPFVKVQVRRRMQLGRTSTCGTAA